MKKAKIQELLQHIERHKNLVICQKVLRGDSRFTDEVDDFYDIHPPHYQYIDENKIGTYPEDLSTVLSPFRKFRRKPFNMDKLEYVVVKKGFQRLDNYKGIEEVVRFGGLLIGGFTAFAGLGILGGSFIADHYVGCAIGTGVYLGGLELGSFSLAYAPGLGEYIKLSCAATNADIFLERYHKGTSDF